MVSLGFLKTVCCSVVFSLNAIASFSAFVVVRGQVSNDAIPSRTVLALAFSNCFSVGLFLGVCYLGLYSSASAKMRSAQDSMSSSNILKSYPLSEAMLCLGIFILWMLEWLIRTLFNVSYKDRFHGKRSSTGKLRTSSNTKSRNVEEVLDDQVVLLAVSDSVDSPTELPHTVSCRREGGTLFKSELTATNSFLRSTFLAAAMGFHTFLEAVGFGLLDSFTQVLSMTLGMALHQLLCSATLGLRLSKTSNTMSTKRCAVLILCVYLLLLPLGSLLGSAVHGLSDRSDFRTDNSTLLRFPNNTVPWPQVHTYDNVVHTGLISRQILVSALQNLAASAFLYVVFIEMLPREVVRGMPCSFHDFNADISPVPDKCGILYCLSALFGFLLVAGIRLIHHR